MTSDSVIKRWAHPQIQNLSAYAVAPAEGLIKLDAMENPYVWDRELKDAWLEELRHVSLNRYPDGRALGLEKTLRQVFEVPRQLDILLGNGSDELIQMVSMTVGGPGRTMLAPEPSFSMYRVIAAITGSDYVATPRRHDFSIDTDALLDAIEKHDPCCVFLANPNNPTGNVCTHEAIDQIAKRCSGIVVVDEAYHAFSGQSVLDQAPAYDNVVVMRTLSKLGLAGLRLGFLSGHPDVLETLNKVRLPYNINSLTQMSVEFALRHIDWFDEKSRLICEARARLFESLKKVSGITAYPSAANFILFRVPAGTGDSVHDDLQRQGVLVKNLNGAHPLLTDSLRVTVSTSLENAAFVDALNDLLG